MLNSEKCIWKSGFNHKLNRLFFWNPVEIRTIVKWTDLIAIRITMKSRQDFNCMCVHVYKGVGTVHCCTKWMECIYVHT